MFGPKGPFCQSCGMPLSKDEGRGGTEKDGSKSKDYCSHCYQNGKFTKPDLTISQMQKQVKEMMQQKMHFPGFLADQFTKNIPNLKRWNKA